MPRSTPRTQRGALPVWVGVGGTVESVVRTARYGLPMMLAVIGGPAARFASFVELFHDSVAQARTAPEGGRLPVGVHSPGFVADTDEEARELLYAHFKANRDRIGRERGWGEVSRAHFDAEVGRRGRCTSARPRPSRRRSRRPCAPSASTAST